MTGADPACPDRLREAALQIERHAEAVLSGHGDYGRWQAAYDALPELPEAQRGWSVHDGVLVAGGVVADRQGLRESLRAFIPWRKGPLMIGGVPIETEWRSDSKWDRIAPHLDLAGKAVLDVGAGNGYFGWRMLEAGAAVVIGCDPMPCYVMQHRVIQRFAGPAAFCLLPLGLEQLPAALTGFDAVFSMGVLYHRSDAKAHLEALRARLAPGGTLVLETLVIEGDDEHVLRPPGRYANMRNVHAIPTVAGLFGWLRAAGFTQVCCLDVTATTTTEQRRTDWMPFHSLEQALGPDGCTREGHPGPVRAALQARAPG